MRPAKLERWTPDNDKGSPSDLVTCIIPTPRWVRGAEGAIVVAVSDGEQLPHRRLRMELSLRADSLADACDALHRIADELRRDGSETVRQASGRSNSGHGLSLEVIAPEMDGGRYRAALESWKAARADR